MQTLTSKIKHMNIRSEQKYCEVNVNQLDETQYIRLMYEKIGTCTDDDYRDWENNPHNLSPGELWWNNVSMHPGSVPPCRRCKGDLMTFNKLVERNDVEEIRKFDTNTSTLRDCTHDACLWSRYFKSRRNKTKAISQPTITLRMKI